MAARGRAGRAVRLTVLGVLMAVLVACTAVYRNHGYVPDDAELARVEIGKDTRETLVEKIGRPSAEGLLNDTGWFYVQSRFRHFGPRAPAEVDRQVLAVTFTNAGTVENIARYGLADGRVVEISRRVTGTTIKGVSFVRQLLANLGRIDAGEMLDR